MTRIAVRSLLALALATTLGVAAAGADTYTVNSTTDAPDGVPGDGVCDAGSGQCTLRAAVQEANAHAGADDIDVPAGLFRLTFSGSGEELAATGDLDVTESLTVNGAGMDATTLDGLASDRLFDAKNGVALTVRDLTIRGGAESAGGGITQLANGTTVVERVRFLGNLSNAGGAILQVAGSLSITDSEFETNFASTGGAVYFTGMGALGIQGSTFARNTTLGSDGAAVYSNTTGAVTVTGSAFRDNGTDSNGGSIYLDMVGSATFTDVLFERNRADGQVAGPLAAANGAVMASNVRSLENFAQVAAGGYFLAGAAAVTVAGLEVADNFSFASATMVVAGAGATLSDSVFRDNVVFSAGTGGGVIAQSTTTLTVSGLELDGNSASTAGGAALTAATTATLDDVHAVGNLAQVVGGFYVTAGTSVSVTNAVADGNDAVQIGGAYVTAPTVAVSDSTISNNVAAGPGGQIGGLYLATANPSTVTNVTISGNHSDATIGGLFAAGAVTVRNSTIAGNTAPMDSTVMNGGGTLTLVSTILAGGGADPCGGAPLTSGGNNIDQSGLCGLAGPGDQNGVDPELGPLADNGGPTLTHLPAATSPAIDTGANAGCPATDQRGQTRPADGDGDGSAVCDVGAVEFLDLCPSDPAKTEPGVCGCGVADTDADQANGTADCLVQGELKARIARAKTIIAALAGDADPAEAELAAIGASFVPYVKAQGTALQAVSPKPKLKKLAKKAGKAVKKVTKAKAGPKLDNARTKATTALDAFDANVAPQP